MTKINSKNIDIMDMKNKTISGEKINLRPLLKSNMKLMQKWHNDKEIMRLFAITRSTNEDYWLSSFERMVKDKSILFFGITLKEDNRLIGYVHLEHIIWSHRLCRDTGILIGEKEEWSKGYGTEAMRLLIKYAFEDLGLHRLELMTFDFNRRGMRVWEKCGFKKEGIMRKARLSDGEWHDLIFFSLLEDEYEDNKNSFTSRAM
jgi:RimJ/RimL family protein N-acetyltransferase